MPQSRLDVSRDPEALAQHVARWIADLARAGTGRFAVCLSGGSTPKRLYQILAGDPFRQELPWERIHWFWGDERFVAWDHKDSNYGMTRAALFAHVPVPPENIHGIEPIGTPADGAARYEGVLRSYYGADAFDPNRPLFDIQLLGLGPDGHTASLIPGTSVLDERRRWVAEVTQGRPEARITLTYPALESSRHSAFLVAGAEKRETLARARAGDRELPAARLRPQGELIWFADAAAAGGG
ncbi:MAG: 6-phosphogluconolactonase [Alphaproteobacteria bacterium]|nr:6-phosphogluconolactonase [Alphaproteobacteria bacterium]